MIPNRSTVVALAARGDERPRANPVALGLGALAAAFVTANLAATLLTLLAL